MSSRWRSFRFWSVAPRLPQPSLFKRFINLMLGIEYVPMELTFLVNSDGQGVKRAQSWRACAPCRLKKKRCIHHSHQPETHNDGRHTKRHRDPSLVPQAHKHNQGTQNAVTSSAGHSSNVSPLSETSATDNTSTSGDGLASRHFACDSNPLVTLMEDDEARLQKGHEQRGDVGAWLGGEHIHPQETHPRSSPVPLSGISCSQTSGIDGLPSKQHQQALVDIYFRRIHPVLPLLDEKKVRDQFERCTLSPCLARAVFLVAAKYQSASSFLSIGHHSTVFTLEQFTSAIYTNLTHSLSKNAERSRITVIQVRALMSLHDWGPSGFEDSSLNLMQAIHHAQTIGLHLARPYEQHDSFSQSLFWCLWSLDTWNAAMNGRPAMIHERDMGHQVEHAISQFEPPFRVWLCLTDKLAKVLRLYRPIADGVDDRELDLPCFEELVEEADAWGVPTWLLDSLEFIYEAVVILASYSKGLQGRSRSRTSHIRQNHSIFCIASLSFARDVQGLLPLPMTAYTISLAFSVTYKQLREGKLSSTRRVASEHLELFHGILKQMSSTWWSTAMMAHFGQRALDKLRAHPLCESEMDVNNLDNQAATIQHNPTSHRLPRSTMDTQRMRDSETEHGHESPAVRRQSLTGISNLDHLLGEPLVPYGEIEDFDTFFDNFLDINFTGCDQFSLGFDVPENILG